MPTPIKKPSTKSRPKAPRTLKTIKVNLTSQIVEAFDSNNRVFRFECVSGDRDHPTDRGIFRVLWKAESHRSRAYDVQMDYALFFTNDGKALHQYHGVAPLALIRAARGNISEWFGSHGCVRLAEADAKALFAWASIGTIVQVS
ncbi:L,D-transpeptidase [Ralstonia nicotianae]